MNLPLSLLDHHLKALRLLLIRYPHKAYQIKKNKLSKYFNLLGTLRGGGHCGYADSAKKR